MARFFWIGTLALFSGCARFAAELPDLTQFASPQKLVFSEDFNAGADRWQLGSNCRVVPEGRDGTPALFMERTEPDDYQSALATLPLQLTPGRSYCCTVWYRTEGVPDRVNILAPCVEYRENNVYKRMKNSNAGTLASLKWKQARLYFEATAECNLLLRLYYNLTGKVWFDDLEIIAVEQAAIYTVKPMLQHLGPEGDVLLQCADNVQLRQRPGDFQLLFECPELGLRTASPLDDRGQVAIRLGPLADGEYTCHAYLLDKRDKAILTQDTFTWFRRADLKPSPGQVTLDEHGRFQVDGKPFLPVGIYVTWIRTLTDVKRVAEGGFNFIHSYTAAYLNIKKENEFNGLPAQEMHGGAKMGTPEWTENVRRSLDLLQQHGLKLMSFPCRDEFRHPTALAAYTADERPVSEIPRLRKLRSDYARTFPLSPVVALTCEADDVGQYARAADLVGVDPYPVTTEKSRDMAAAQKFMDNLSRDNIPFMYVPQAFNWGGHRTDDFSKYVYPSEEQIRSMTLLAAIYGCRCFCFYSYTTIFERTELKAPGSAVKFWPRVTAVARLLRELEPWLLSLEQAPEVTCTLQKDSVVKARAFAADNEVRVLITAQGPGEAQAELTIPGCPDLKSKYGHTTNLGNGRYLFTGNDIASDVLTKADP